MSVLKFYNGRVIRNGDFTSLISSRVFGLCAHRKRSGDFVKLKKMQISLLSKYRCTFKANDPMYHQVVDRLGICFFCFLLGCSGQQYLSIYTQLLQF